MGLILFGAFSFVRTNDICCMFVAKRAYGFPGQYLILSKETDSWEEAQKVKTLPVWRLLEQGWKVRLGAEYNSPVSPVAAVNLVVNLGVWLGAGWVVVWLGRRILKRERSGEES